MKIFLMLPVLGPLAVSGHAPAQSRSDSTPTVANLGIAAWPIVALVMLPVGVLVKRILEESVAAEELNKILAMEQVVSSDIALSDSF